MEIATELTELLRTEGVNLVGFADITNLPGDARCELPRAVSFAVALRPDIITSILDGPTVQYHKEYVRANRLLDGLSCTAAQLLRDYGFRSVSSAATNEGIDPKTHSTRLPHKTVATRAGIGWIGKCALLITKDYGSAIRINRVLTDAPLPTAVPITESMCGDCRTCVDACPGHAPSGKTWSEGLHRDEFYNAFECRKAARKLAVGRTGIQETFCGICIAVCPWTKKYIERSTQP